MGWSYAYVDVGRKAHIESLTNQSHWSPGYTPLKHRVIGNHVWQLVLIGKTGIKMITLDLIAKERNGGWGHKSMSEFDGPCYYDCPLSYLDQASEPTGYAVEWRERVRRYHATKPEKKKLVSGLVVRYGDHAYRLDRPYAPRKGWAVTRLDDGCTFRMNAKQLANAKVGD